MLSSVQYFKSIDGGRVSFSVPINEPGSARDNCCSLKTAARACYLRLVPVTTEPTGSERSNLETLQREKAVSKGRCHGRMRRPSVFPVSGRISLSSPLGVGVPLSAHDGRVAVWQHVLTQSAEASERDDGGGARSCCCVPARAPESHASGWRSEGRNTGNKCKDE